MVNKLLDLAQLHEDVPPTVRAHYSQLEKPASACVGCKSCEQRCPFGVKIADRMQSAARLFEGAAD